MSAAKARGPVALFKQLWNEYPEVVGSTFMGLIGISMGITGLVIYEKKNCYLERRYVHEYTVIRHDDPRVSTLRRD